MNIRLIIVFFTAITIASCGGEQVGENNISSEEQLSVIKSTEDELYANKDKFDFQKAILLVKKYDQFATEFPDHKKAAEFLFRAGDLSSGMNKSEEAIAFFDRVYNDYSNYSKSSDALFLKAFVLENQVKDLEQAGKIYGDFIDKYPNHPMKESAEFSIQNLGKSPEELIRQFEDSSVNQLPQ